MKALSLSFLSIFIAGSAFATGTVSSGGSGMILPRPTPTTETPAPGEYQNSATIGWSSGNTLRLTTNNQFHLAMALGRDGTQRIDGRISRQADGSLAAEAIVDGRCSAKIRVVSLRWPNDSGLRGSVRLEIPYWLGDYLFTPEKYGFRCERAAELPDFQNLAPSGDFYELAP